MKYSAQNPVRETYFLTSVPSLIKTKTRVKLAAKLLVIAWTLMKKREPFEPEYLQIG